MKARDIIVVGAGFGGLAAAALLAKKGFNVTVLEKNGQAGGRARVWREKGFVFDMGPSWYLMPDVFEKFFAEFDKAPSDFYRLFRLDPNYRVFFGDGKTLDVPAALDKIQDIFESLEKKAGASLKKYLAVSEYQYEVAMKDFMYRDYASLFDFLNWELISKGLRLHIFESVDKFARRYFKSDKIRKILEYTMVFLGGSPYNTPALYSIMSHVDFNLGVWYPLGGLGELVSAFQKLAESQGARIILEEEVKKIEVEEGAAKKVVTGQNEYKGDVILVNADYHHAETELLEDKYVSYPEKYWSKTKMGPSAFLIYLGLSKKIDGLLHHNLYLDPSWDEHFQSIFKRPEWPASPSYYVCCPSKSDASVAPKEHENIFVLVPVAPGLEDSQDIREKYFDKTIDHLEKLLGEEIRGSIVVKRIYAHSDFARDYNAYKGTALGMSHTLFQTAVFRPARRSKKVGNLYYTGSYTHPGIGVPMVIISSQIVSRLISERYGA